MSNILGVMLLEDNRYPNSVKPSLPDSILSQSSLLAQC